MDAVIHTLCLQQSGALRQSDRHGDASRRQGPGYWETTSFLNEVDKSGTTFYDSITGKALFAIPRGRSYEEWEAESRHHGWPSFRDEEVIWEDFRCLANGEAVSTNGTHLGHCIPDAKGAAPSPRPS